MRKVEYAMQFQGSGQPVEEKLIKAATRSPSTCIDSVVGGNGLSCEMKPIDGGEATFTSEVRLTGETSFTETGTITFGDGNSLEFSTIGEGFLGASPEEGLNHGIVMWRIERGTGQFDGASGLITSNFTFSAAGEVTDNQFGLIWVK